jgi:orotidine-5'-phosphate decarboxylase
MVSPVLVALDFSHSDEAKAMARSLAPHVGGFKVGLELLLSEGPDMVSDIAALGLPVFVDAKLHDIPNTVGGAARALGRHGARWVTVHAGGGQTMIEEAVTGLDSGSDAGAGILVVTVLTSLDDGDLASVGVHRTVGDQVEAMSLLAGSSGAEGVVCAPTEIARARAASADLLVVTPGIRMAGGESHDQKRVSDPKTALAAGADYLVVGRAITRATDPVEAALALGQLLAG